MKNKLQIVFLCTGNSCRSQMGEGWARHLYGDHVDVYSAGTHPHGLNPLAVKVMAEAGVDISGHSSNHVDDLKHIPLDLAVTVCDRAQETCPVFPGAAKTIHHSFDDPPQLAKEAPSEEEALKHYRRVRDEIKEFVQDLKLDMEKTK